ncbi:hypothetical protein SAMN05444395_11113 [Flavobacterium fryxellicola]|uniref:Uncharacterized protein n=1 Tax=Flavobacterium fryxellicola TaxID=249352 RepID=A0A167ZK85_9FLAO|nr:hypothetical protein [Flavobacterium fryxellicola]OAB30535.1 hypothetical protein FBFR_01685 [Flavobacterium fryxellicola]SHN76838.1 hypothetical protein SAMN05444395_11113 [Flavobacterium fryxellicola]
MKMEYPILESLKKYKTHFNAEQFISLNPDSDFGNLNLIWTQIVVRIECVNTQIIDLYQTFYIEKAKRESEGFAINNLDESYMDIMITEQIFYWLRKTTDEIISLTSLSTDFENNGTYPKKIKVSSIGEFLKLKTPFIGVIEKHKDLLKLLNEISNTFKHSFINPQIMAYIGSEYPVVFAYNLHFNDLKNQGNFIQIELKKFLNDYDIFLLDIKEYINENFTV